MEILFWSCVILGAYVYAGYALLLAGWARLGTREVHRRPDHSRAPWPSVSIVLAAHNEGSRLPDRIINLLQQDYPGPTEIIVVSDGSSDDTRERLRPFGDRIRLLDIPRGGKPRALNAGVAVAEGEIVVFADARQRFGTDAVRRLVENFEDPAVGGVTGELLFERTPDGSAISEEVGLYWRYEKALRRLESRVGSTLGATGAIYALRRSLWRPLPPQTLLDDVLAPMRAVLAGYRVVFDDRALAFDRPERDSATESRRKTRTLGGNYQILALEPRLLIPFVNPVWLQYASHKIGRLLVPWCLVGTFIASAALALHSWFYMIAFAVQLAFYGLALLGAAFEAQELNGTTRAGKPESNQVDTPVHRKPGQLVPDRGR